MVWEIVGRDGFHKFQNLISLLVLHWLLILLKIPDSDHFLHLLEEFLWLTLELRTITRFNEGLKLLSNSIFSGHIVQCWVIFQFIFIDILYLYLITTK